MEIYHNFCVCDQKEQEKVPRQQQQEEVVEEERTMSWPPPEWTSGWARSSVWRR